MDEQDKVWETIYGVARQVASRANRIHRGLVSTDDLYQHILLCLIIESLTQLIL